MTGGGHLASFVQLPLWGRGPQSPRSHPDRRSDRPCENDVLASVPPDATTARRPEGGRAPMPETRPICSQSPSARGQSHRRACTACAADAPIEAAEPASTAKTRPAKTALIETAALPSHCPSRNRQMKTIKFILPPAANNDWGCTNNSGFGRKSPGKALGAKTYVGR